MAFSPILAPKRFRGSCNHLKLRNIILFRFFYRKRIRKQYAGYPRRWQRRANLPDIQPEGSRRQILWISGRENGQNRQKPGRISTQTVVEGRFTGYPARRPGNGELPDIRQGKWPKRAKMVPDIHANRRRRQIYRISGRRTLGCRFRGYPARGPWNGNLPDIRPGAGVYTARVLERSQAAWAASRRGERVRKTRSL